MEYARFFAKGRWSSPISPACLNFVYRAISQNCWVRFRCITPNGQITHHSHQFHHYLPTESIHIISLSCISCFPPDPPEALT